MSKTVSVDTVALLASYEAIMAEYPDLRNACELKKNNLFPVRESCDFELAACVAAKSKLEKFIPAVLGSPHAAADSLEKGDVTEEEKVSKARAKADARNAELLEARNAEIVEDLTHAYEKASDRLMAKRKDVEMLYVREQTCLSTFLDRIRKSFTEVTVTALCHTSLFISAQKGPGQITPWELHAKLRQAHDNRPRTGVWAATGLYHTATLPLQLLGSGATATWNTVISSLKKIWSNLEGDIEELYHELIGEMMTTNLRRGGLPLKGVVDALEAVFPYDLPKAARMSDTRSFADLFDALESMPVMKALSDVHRASSPVPPRGAKEIAKKAAVPGAPPSVSHDTARICYDFVNGRCTRGEECKWRHVQVVDVPKK